MIFMPFMVNLLLLFLCPHQHHPYRLSITHHMLSIQTSVGAGAAPYAFRLPRAGGDPWWLCESVCVGAFYGDVTRTWIPGHPVVPSLKVIPGCGQALCNEYPESRGRRFHEAWRPFRWIRTRIWLFGTGLTVPCTFSLPLLMNFMPFMVMNLLLLHRIPMKYPDKLPAHIFKTDRAQRLLEPRTKNDFYRRGNPLTLYTKTNPASCFPPS